MRVKTLGQNPDGLSRKGISCGCGCGPVASPGRVGRHLPLLPALVLVVLPKCPLCVAAWVGVLGSLGTSSWVLTLYGTPLTLALISVALCAIALSYLATREPRPLLVGLLGALIMLLGRGRFDVPPLVYAGLLLLSAAVVWSNCTRARSVSVAKR